MILKPLWPPPSWSSYLKIHLINDNYTLKLPSLGFFLISPQFSLDAFESEDFIQHFFLALGLLGQFRVSLPQSGVSPLLASLGLGRRRQLGKGLTLLIIASYGFHEINCTNYLFRIMLSLIIFLCLFLFWLNSF